MSTFPTESVGVGYPLQEDHALQQITVADHVTQVPRVQHQTDCHKLANAVTLPEQHETVLQPEYRMLAASNQNMSRLNDTHHSILHKQLTKHAAAWRQIGTHLGFTQGELDNIQAIPSLYTGAPISWLSKMLVEWLQRAPGDSRESTSFATLDNLKAALNEAGFGATAHDLGVW